MSGTFVPLIGPIPGGMEMVVILLIAVLLFGANKIPKLARSTGQAMGEFQRGREEIEEELQEVGPESDDSADTAPIDTSTTDSETSTTDTESASTSDVDDEPTSSN